MGLKGLDSLTTYIGINFLGLREINYIPSLINDTFGTEVMIALVFAAHYGIIIYIYNKENKRILHSKSITLTTRIVWGLNILLTIVLCLNTYNIVKGVL